MGTALNYISRGIAFVADVILAVLALLGRTIARVYVFCENWLLDGKKAATGLAMTRIAFGITGIGLLLSNFSTRLYAFGSGAMWNGEYENPPSQFMDYGIFRAFHSLMTNNTGYTLLYLFVLVLAVLFTLGWRFKIVLPVYFFLWVGFIEATDGLGDQGDNMYRIAMILLFFTDPVRRMSLDARRRRKAAEKPDAPWAVRVWRGEPLLHTQPEIGSLFNNLALVALTAQVCFVYASGALYKAGGSPWSDGWAVYHPLQTVQFGTWPELSHIVISWSGFLIMASWGSIIIQMCFPMMLLTHPTRVIALFGIMSFHLAIALLMGLPWFSLAMIAIDFIFITEHTWESVRVHARRLWRRTAVKA